MQDLRPVLELDYSLDVVPCSAAVASLVLVPCRLDGAYSGFACSQWEAACTDTELGLAEHTGYA